MATMAAVLDPLNDGRTTHGVFRLRCWRPPVGLSASGGTTRGSSRRFLATGTNANENTEPLVVTTNTESSVASVGESTTPTSKEAVATAEALLKAPFAAKLHAKVNVEKQSGLFPWRSSSDLLERLVPGTPDHASKGLLLGGNLTSSNPNVDAFATACFFLRIPFGDLIFFRTATEQDLADSMAWAFGAAVREITAGGGREDVENDDSNNESGSNGRFASPGLRNMMEAKKLAKLFESASEFGKDSLQVKLETKPILYNSSNYSSTEDGGSGEEGNETNHEDSGDESSDDLPFGLREGPKIVSLFVFPFFSRDQISDNRDPHHVRKYSRLLDAISASNDENEEKADTSYASSLEMSRELMEDFRQKGVSENTVVCQVLVPCKETFWVKDTTTGEILQGGAQQRTVLHLVRFEQVTKTHIINDNSRSRFFPFRHELGEWKITDIDDLCDGNLLL
jgi:hypothetical protein